MLAQCLATGASCIAAAVCLIGSAAAQPRLSHIDATVEEELVRQDLPGALVAVARGDAIVHVGAYGHSDRGRTDPLSEDDVFPWASISKSLTTLTVVMADQRAGQRFSIDDPVHEHVPSWDKGPWTRSMTIRHTLSNRSGIVHYAMTNNCPSNASPNVDRSKHESKRFDAEQSVATFADQRLCFRPGTQYKYSTAAFSLAALALERATGVEHTRFVQANVARPLGMDSLTQMSDPSDGFTRRCGRVEPKKADARYWVLPGGGWASDIEDLAAMGNGIIQGKLASADALWADALAAGPPAQGAYYGLGMFLTGDGNVAHHGGSHANLQTHMRLYFNDPDKIVVVVYVNSRHGDAARVARQVYSAVKTGAASTPASAAIARCSDDPGEDEDDCPGRYAGLWQDLATDVETVQRFGLRPKAFRFERSWLARQGWRLHDFEARRRGGLTYYDGVFRKEEGRPQVLRLGDDRAEFLAYWENATGNGWRLVDLERHEHKGKPYWNGLFERRRIKQGLFRNLDRADFVRKYKELDASGLSLIDVETYIENGRPLFAGVWAAGAPKTRLQTDLPESTFQRFDMQRRVEGERLFDIAVYERGGDLFYSGLWREGTGASQIRADQAFCTTPLGGLDVDGFLDGQVFFSKVGRSLVDYEPLD